MNGIFDFRFAIFDLGRRLDSGAARSRKTGVRSFSVNRKSKIGNRKSPRGVILLEVILALTLFVFAAAVVGSAMNSSLQATIDIRMRSTAGNLAMSKLAELTCGSAAIADASATPFESDPDWTYEIATEPMQDVTNLIKVTITVKNANSPQYCETLTQWVLNPFAGEMAGTATSQPEGSP